MGVDKIRLTGGEPLLRADLGRLIELLAAKPGLRDIALTTNGVLLANAVGEMQRLGLRRVTVSLDTLDPTRFRNLSQRSNHAAVMAGIEAIASAGLANTKLNCVVVRGTNDDEVVALVEYSKSVNAEVRFIEYMDVGGASRWDPTLVVSREEILERLEQHYGPIAAPTWTDPAAPAERFVLPDGTTVGIVASTTKPFCGACDRSRLTADGVWFLCLYALTGTDLRTPLRSGGKADLVEAIRGGWSRRTDAGAEDRLSTAQRRPLLPLRILRADPHLEMHTRGG
jgi:cyclic pyranopterin phosphate synthase